MNDQKPHFRVVAGRPVEVSSPESRIDAARKRFGGPFSHEPGTRWKPHEVPVLTAWMQSRGKAST